MKKRLLPTLILICVCLVLVVLIILLARSCVTSSTITIGGNDEKIDDTPQTITEIKDIGQWEFLSLSNEELVDSVRKGILQNDEIVRIYYGTLRLGVDLHNLKPHWFEQTGDSIIVIVPKIQLLDNDFIDEALTQSFFEKGKWDDKDRKALYSKAHRQMKERCMTPENIRVAEDNGRQQLTNLFESMGYKNVAIKYE